MRCSYAMCVVMLVVLSATWSSVTQAQLQWEKTEENIKPSMGKSQIVVQFRFANTGKYPLSIREVKGDRDCVVTALSKHTYRSGESGLIEVAVSFGRYQGKHVQTIRVLTDERKDATTTLSVNVDIPQMLSIQPAFVRWEAGEKPKAKTITIKTLGDVDVKVLGARLFMDRIKLNSEIKEVKAGKEYTLTVTPDDIAKPGMAMLELQTSLPADSSPHYYIMVMVQSPMKQVGPSFPGSSSPDAKSKQLPSLDQFQRQSQESDARQ